MSTLIDVLVIIGLFTLRIGVPLAVIAGLAYVLKQLDRRWEAEARVRPGVKLPVERPAEQLSQRAEAPQPVSEPGNAVPQPPVDTGRVREPTPAGRGNGDRRS